MAGHTNRTFICSVLFLDIVDYSAKVVPVQIALKERFNAVLTEAIAGVAADDRIILDTGDGAAVNFLGDPEDALFAGMSLRDSVANQEVGAGPRLQIRVGINLGPVRFVKDINGQPNIIGDGINVAQRVMSFAEPAQILVSRSYYDVMARLSEDYAKLFRYEGAKTDKHVREHEVWSISSAPSTLRRTLPVPPPRQTMRLPSLRIPRLPRLSARRLSGALAVNPKLLVAAPLAFTLIVGTGVIARSHRNPGSDTKTAESLTAAAKLEPPLVKLEAGEAASPPQAQEQKAQKAEETKAPQAKEPKNSRRARETVAAPKASATTLAARANEAEAAPKEAATPPKARETEFVATAPVSSSREATLNIVALPWAEVFVDGTRQGVSPPLRSIPLRPGKHRVELRNTSFPAHVQTVELKPGTEISITHRFRR